MKKPAKNKKEPRSLKQSVSDGCDRFWAKRGGDPNKESSFNYGNTPKRKRF